MSFTKFRYLILEFLRENFFKFDLPFMEERRNFFMLKQKKKFINYLNKRFPNLEISMLEVGSKEGLCYNYQVLKYLKNFHLEGIEPQKDEALKTLKSKKYPYKKIYTEAVSSINGKKTLYITKSKGCSSLYKPNFNELKKYHEEEGFQIIKEEKVIVKKLDFLMTRNFDFINLDIQGSEYDALKGGNKLLNTCIGLSFECHLFPLYKNQKLFSDIHNLIKKNFRILRFKTRTYKGILFELSDVSAIKEVSLISNKEDLIKNILYSILWERKEYISVLLANKGNFLSKKERRDIKKILNLS